MLIAQIILLLWLLIAISSFIALWQTCSSLFQFDKAHISDGLFQINSVGNKISLRKVIL